MVENPPAMQETPVQSLGQEDPLEKPQYSCLGNSMVVVWVRHPAVGSAGSWVMPGLGFKWRPSWAFSLINTPGTQAFAGGLESWTLHSHPRDSDPASDWGIKIPQLFVMEIKRIKTNQRNKK